LFVAEDVAALADLGRVVGGQRAKVRVQRGGAPNSNLK